MDKQIIIDGVDVSWCRHIDFDCANCEFFANMCHENPNCFYKRKEKECDQLKAENEELNFVNEKLKAENMEYFESINDINKKIDKYEQALQEIRNLASCGKDMYVERGKYENYEAMAEWMKNQFYFILNKISEVEDVYRR